MKGPAALHLCCHRPRALLCGDASDVREDCFKIRESSCVSALPEQSGADIWDVATRSEILRAQAYWHRYVGLDPSKRCELQDLVVRLNDNPAGASGWVTWSAISRQIPTIRRSSGKFLSFHAGRHLLLRELFLAMGYPTFPFAAASAGVPYRVFTPSVTHTDMRRALGNSFHAVQVGVFMLALLCSTKLQGS